MADIFISYAREDKEFVCRLRDAFDKAELDTWVDWEDIPGSAKWLEAVQAGIAASDIFLFVISPSSAHSKACFEEADYAKQTNKRIIPLLYRTIDDDVDLPDLHPVIREHNWIFIHEGDDFDKAFKELLKAINTDLEFVKKHTEFFTRAQSWDRDDRHDSALLRGNDLRSAEAWLVESSSKEPKPTSLHTDYIFMGRRVETRRQRRNRVISTIVMSLLSVLTIAAVYFGISSERNAEEARESQAQAEHNAEETRLQAIIANNQLQTTILINNTAFQPVGLNPKQPLLMGVDLWVVNESGQIWQLRADSGQPRAAPIEVGGDLHRPVYDGKYLWIGSITEDKLVRIDPTDIQTAEIIDVDRSAFPPIVTDGSWIWVLTQRKLVSVNRETLKIGLEIPVGRDPKFPVSDGTYVWVLDADRTELYRTHAETGETESLPLNGSFKQPIAAGGQLWIADASNNQLLRVDPTTLMIADTIQIEERIDFLTTVGNWLWLARTAPEGASVHNEIIQIDPASGAILQRISAERPVRALYVHKDALWVYENGPDVYTINLDTYRRDFTISNVSAQRLSEPVFTPDHVWIADSAGNRIYVITLGGEIVRQLPQCATPTAPVFDGAMMWAACRGDQTVVRIPAMLDYHGQSSGIEQISENSRPYPPLLIDQNLWIVQEADGKVIVYNTRPQEIMPDTRAFDVGTYPSSLTQDSAFLWLTNDDTELGIGLYRFNADDVDDPEVIRLGPGSPDKVKVIKGKLWFLTTTDTTNPADNDLLIVDPDTGTVEKTIDAGLFLTGFVEDNNVIWVNAAHTDGGSLCRLDAETGANLGCIKIDHIPAREPVIIGDSVWVSGAIPGGLFEGLYKSIFSTEASTENGPSIPGALYEFLRSDGQLIRKIDLEHSPWMPVSAGPYLWFTETARIPQVGANYNRLNEYLLTALDPSTGSVVKQWNPCQHMLPPFYAGKLLYGTCLGTSDDPGNLLVINPETLTEVYTYTDLGQGAWPPILFGDWIWIVYRDTGNAAVLRADTGELEHLYSLGQAPTPPVYDGQRYIWIANTVDATVQRIIAPE